MQVSLFTRINVALGVVAFSLIPVAPLLGRLRANHMTTTYWIGLVLGIALLQALLLLAQKRCTSEDMPFWRGLLIVGVAMSTGWFYLDIVIVLLAIPLALAAAVVFLLSRNPAVRYHRLIYRFYQHRMEQ